MLKYGLGLIINQDQCCLNAATAKTIVLTVPTSTATQLIISVAATVTAKSILAAGRLQPRNANLAIIVKLY